MFTTMGILLSFLLGIAQSFRPQALPLAVKNPYLNGWYGPGPNSEALTAITVHTWNSSDSPWYCSVMVDGTTYRIMEADANPALNASNQTSITITPTLTTIHSQIGPLNVTLNYLSPITPGDWIRQSLPFSYFYITIAPTDEAPHTVKVFSDYSPEWITGDTNSVANGSGGIEPDYIFVQTSLQSPQPFVEINDHAQDSTMMYATRNVGTVAFQAGGSETVRGLWVNGTALSNTIDSDVDSHPINNPHDVFAISVDLGQITSSTTLVWSIGVTRDPSIRFTRLSGDVQFRNSFYQMNFSTHNDMVSFLLKDFEYVSNVSAKVDMQIMNDAMNVSSMYVDLLSLIARQAMGALEITVSKNADGGFNSSDIMVFLKDMGDIGAGGVNAVGVIYASFPMYLYIDPNLLGFLLKPLLVVQDTPQYTQPYSAQNLGTQFPNATAEDVQHNFGIEESGNMIIMLLAHLQMSRDMSLVSQYYNTIQGWADYLVQNSMKPGSQQTSYVDGIAQVNQTNLALKGIIGIGAMAEICKIMNKTSDAQNYNGIAKMYISQWTDLSISRDKSRFLLSFGNETSTGIIYNLYADKLLNLTLIPQSVYDIQTAYLNSALASSYFGIPFNSENPTLCRADWLVFAAASSDDENLRKSLISLIHSYIFTPINNNPTSPVYNPVTGNPSSIGVNSPAMGAMFAILALNKTSQRNPFVYTPPDTPLTPHNGLSMTSRIAIGTSTGIVVLITIVGISVVIRHRRQRKIQIAKRRSRPYRASPNSTPTLNSSRKLAPSSARPSTYNDKRSVAEEHRQNDSGEAVAELDQMELPVDDVHLRNWLVRMRGEIVRYLQGRELEPPPSYHEFASSVIRSEASL